MPDSELEEYKQSKGLSYFNKKEKKNGVLENDTLGEHWDKKMLSKTGEHFYPKFFKKWN